MKKLKNLIYLLFFAPTFFIAQEDTELYQKLEEEHKNHVFFEQNLTDFNEKIYSIFIASYKEFSTITEGDEFKKTDSKHIKTSVDFQNGKNEIININEKSKSYRVEFECNQDEMLARALQKELTMRIMKLIPKGFIQTEDRFDTMNLITINFNPKYAEKGTFQPTIELILDYESLNVAVSINEPVKK